MHARRVDICFLRRPADDPDVVNELAWPARVGVILPDRHPLASQNEVALLDLRHERHAFLRLRDSRFARYLRDSCVEAGFMPCISQQVVEAYSLNSLVAAGLGVALVPECISNLSRPGVVYRPLAKPAPIADVKMIYRPDRSAVVDQFVSMARKGRGARIRDAAQLPQPCLGSGDADVGRASQLQHAVQDLDRHVPSQSPDAHPYASAARPRSRA